MYETHQEKLLTRHSRNLLSSVPSSKKQHNILLVSPVCIMWMLDWIYNDKYSFVADIKDITIELAQVLTVTQAVCHESRFVVL